VLIIICLVGGAINALTSRSRRCSHSCCLFFSSSSSPGCGTGGSPARDGQPWRTEERPWREGRPPPAEPEARSRAAQKPRPARRSREPRTGRGRHREALRPGAERESTEPNDGSEWVVIQADALKATADTSSAHRCGSGATWTTRCGASGSHRIYSREPQEGRPPSNRSRGPAAFPARSVEPGFIPLRPLTAPTPDDPSAPRQRARASCTAPCQALCAERSTGRRTSWFNPASERGP
jgi:hypothetical protein